MKNSIRVSSIVLFFSHCKVEYFDIWLNNLYFIHYCLFIFLAHFYWITGLMTYRKFLQIWEMDLFLYNLQVFFFPVCHLSFDFVSGFLGFFCHIDTDFYIVKDINLFFLTFEFWFRLWKAFLLSHDFGSAIIPFLSTITTLFLIYFFPFKKTWGGYVNTCTWFSLWATEVKLNSLKLSV